MREYRPARQVIQVIQVVLVTSNECGCVTELFEGGVNFFQLKRAVACVINSRAGRNQGNMVYIGCITKMAWQQAPSVWEHLRITFFGNAYKCNTHRACFSTVLNHCIVVITSAFVVCDILIPRLFPSFWRKK